MTFYERIANQGAHMDNYLLSNPEKLNAIGIKQRNETEHINIKSGDQAIKGLFTWKWGTPGR